MALSAVHSKVVVLLVFNDCSLLFQLRVKVLWWVIVLQYFCVLSFCNHPAWGKRVGYNDFYCLLDTMLQVASSSVCHGLFCGV